MIKYTTFFLAFEPNHYKCDMLYSALHETRQSFQTVRVGHSRARELSKREMCGITNRTTAVFVRRRFAKLYTNGCSACMSCSASRMASAMRTCSGSAGSARGIAAFRRAMNLARLAGPGSGTGSDWSIARSAKLSCSAWKP